MNGAIVTNLIAMSKHLGALGPSAPTAALRLCTFIVCFYCATALGQAEDNLTEDEPKASPQAFAAPSIASRHQWHADRRTQQQDGIWLATEPKQIAQFTQQTQGQTKGAVLLIPASGATLAQDALLHNLYRDLPDQGWSALAVSRSHESSSNSEFAVANTNTPADEPDTNDGETSDEAVGNEPDIAAVIGSSSQSADSSANKPSIDMPIQAAIAYLEEQGIRNIAVISSGRACPEVIQAINQLKPTSVRAVVLLNAQNRSALTSENLGTILAELNLPSLDLLSQKRLAIQIQAQERQAKLRQQRHRRYQQVTLPYANTQRHHPLAQHESSASKRVRGWLDRNILGQEIGAR